MKDDKIEYKNWVPKKMIYAFFICEIILIIFLIIPIHFIIDIILWIILALVTLFGVLVIYAYFKFGENDNAMQREVHDVLLDKLNWVGNGQALDIGTGNGGLVIKLARKFSNSKVLGIDFWGRGWDYSREECERNARIAKVAEQVQFQKASAAKLPFENETFDAVVSNFVFHEVRDLKNKKELIFEALRVLKKGGAFSFQDYFNTRIYYGKKEELVKDLENLGLQEFHLKNLNESMKIPFLLRFQLFLGNMVTLYGIK